MPATSKHITPKKYEVVFDEASHIYTACKDGEKKRLISCTTFVHTFCPLFDPNGEIAARKANERGVSVETIKAEWKKKADDACAMGTRVHETCEDILHRAKTYRNSPQSPHERALMSAGFQACQMILKNFEIVGIEQMVADYEIGLAGTIDLLAKSRKDGTYFVFDWKTNDKIQMSNNFGQKMLFELSHLDDCSFNHYSLQLNLYEYLLKRNGYVQKDAKFDRAIIHLTDAVPRVHKIPDRGIEVRDMIIGELVREF